jgi:uncharacterized membrane protein YqjE
VARAQSLEDEVAARPAPQIDPDAGIPDLVRRLTDDSKRLVRDEVRLAKLETADGLRRGARGALWLGLAFGAGVVALVALTLLLVSLLGRWIGHHYWAGALIVGVVELVCALLLIRRGLTTLRSPSYTFEASRAELKETVDWARSVRAE